MADMTDEPLRGLTDTSDMLDALALRTRELELGANAFARAMTRAFSSSVSGGKQFDDILKSLALRMSDLAVRMARGPDGRLGVRGEGGGGASISVTIATPDADSFRRSESYIAGQIARAVARGQRNL